MTTQRRSLRNFLATGLIALSFAGSATAGRAPEPAAPVVQDKMDEFKRLFEQSAKINAKEEMARLVRQYNEEAILWILSILERVSAQQGSDALYEQLNQLRAAWNSSIKSRFVDQVEKYFSLLHPSARSEREQYVRVYRMASGELQGAREARDVAKIHSMSGRFEELAGQFEAVGDFYYAGQCWANAVAANHPDNVGVDVDFNKLADLLGEFVRTREAIDLKDALYGQNKASYGQLSAQGFGKNAAAGTPTGGGEAGVDPGGDPGAPMLVPRGSLPSGDPVAASLQFEAIEELDAIRRPNYNSDEAYPMWMALSFLTKGTTSEFARVKDAPKVYRTGSREIEIDTDSDGTPDLEIPITGNVNLVQFNVGQGAEARPWAVLTTVGNQSDFYQGIPVNLAPNDEGVLIYYTSASSVVGEIAGVSVRVIDEDLDGVFGSTTKTWAWMGLTPENFQPEMDSIVIGEKAKRALPWSEYLELDDVWYKLEPASFGQELKATPYDLPTGRLKLDFKGLKPTWLVVRGTGRFQNCLFDLADAGSKGVEVPVGKYTLYYGEVRKGSKRQEAKTLILPGKNTSAWDVTEGGTTTVVLGKPFGFDFAFQQTESDVTIQGNTVTVVGSAGERYERPWNCVPRPEVSIRKAGTKTGTKPKKMEFIVGTDQLFSEGWEWAWSPLNTVIKKAGGDGTVEVQLTEKKNKLFGNVESDWKP